MNSELASDFKLAMRRLTTTVTVLTCSGAGQRFGMTATAVTSVCAEPPSLLVCVNRSASFHSPMADADRFCVNLLKVGQQNISGAFGGKKKGDEKFTEGVWLSSDDGIPYLADAQANLFCSASESFSFETHTIFVGRVESLLMADEISPLLYQDGGFARALSLADGA
jgi:flavin reductase